MLRLLLTRQRRRTELPSSTSWFFGFTLKKKCAWPFTAAAEEKQTSTQAIARLASNKNHNCQNTGKCRRKRSFVARFRLHRKLQEVRSRLKVQGHVRKVKATSEPDAIAVPLPAPLDRISLLCGFGCISASLPSCTQSADCRLPVRFSSRPFSFPAARSRKSRISPHPTTAGRRFGPSEPLLRHQLISSNSDSEMLQTPLTSFSSFSLLTCPSIFSLMHTLTTVSLF